MHRALTAAGGSLAAHPALVQLLQQRLFPALAAALAAGGLGTVSGTCQARSACLLSARGCVQCWQKWLVHPLVLVSTPLAVRLS